jgi:hypothetical protein
VAPALVLDDALWLSRELFMACYYELSKPKASKYSACRPSGSWNSHYLIFPPGLIVALAAKNIIIPQEATMSLFKGYKLRTPAGYLSEQEQAALITHLTTQAAKQPAVAREVRLVCKGRKDASEISPETLGVLREIANAYLVGSQPRSNRQTQLRLRLV